MTSEDKAQQNFDELNPGCPWIDDDDTYGSRAERRRQLEIEAADDSEE